MKKLRKLAAAEGFALEELLSLPPQPQATAPAKAERVMKAVAQKRALLPIRYAHPGNSELKWSGRSRRPSWVELWTRLGGMSQSVCSVGEAVLE